MAMGSGRFPLVLDAPSGRLATELLRPAQVTLFAGGEESIDGSCDPQKGVEDDPSGRKPKHR